MVCHFLHNFQRQKSFVCSQIRSKQRWRVHIRFLFFSHKRYKQLLRDLSSFPRLFQYVPDSQPTQLQNFLVLIEGLKMLIKDYFDIQLLYTTHKLQLHKRLTSFREFLFGFTQFKCHISLVVQCWNVWRLQIEMYTHVRRCGISQEVNKPQLWFDWPVLTANSNLQLGAARRITTGACRCFLSPSSAGLRRLNIRGKCKIVKM